LRATLTVGVLVGLLLATAGVAFYAWQELGEVPISRHGLIALGLGAGATLALGVGLMLLLFRSHHRGHDDAVHEFARRQAERRRRADRDPD
jgi:hypothetical protein